MNWYYVDAQQQAGPVDDAQLEELVRTGKIQTHTLVWREGMANWQPYGEATAPGQSPAPAQTAPASDPTTPPVMPMSQQEAVCVECQRIFNVNYMIRHGAVHVCGGCKPVFMQKLQEGAYIPGGGATPINTLAATPDGLRYAGFWIRVLAKFLDQLILTAVLMIPMILIFVIFGFPGSPNRATGPRPEFIFIQLLIYVVQFAIYAIYSIYFVGKHAATPGKMICGLKVIAIDGGKISYGRATGRLFADILSAMICYIGYFIAGFDPQKRALHDHICSTYVIYK